MMLNKIKNNRGITLIEVIIAITILTIVIGLGYSVINKSNESINKQQVITKGQMDANLINKYVTKDLEQSKLVIEQPKDTSKDYEYSISVNEGYVKYKVIKNDDTRHFNLVREADNSSVEIISRQSMSNQEPFTIKPSSQNSKIYKVKLHYIENKLDKVYSFDVYPRLVNNNVIKPPNPEEIPEEIEKEFSKFGYLGFWAADKEKQSNENLYVWSDDKSGNIIDNLGNQKKNLQYQELYAEVNPNNAGNQGIASINKDESSTGSFNSPHLGNKVVDKITIYVSKGVRLKNLNIDSEKNKNNITHGIVREDIMEPNTIKSYSVRDVEQLNISGKLEVLDTDGYVLIIYGKSNK